MHKVKRFNEINLPVILFVIVALMTIVNWSA